MTGPVGRFAPSPSGRLHLGNLACSLLAWLSAKSQGGKIVLRIEDLDAARCPRIYADQLEEDLRWLGLVWDEGGSDGGPHGPYYQSECAGIYTESYRKLEQMGLVYPCFCSRAQLHAASAPHTSDGNVVYPGTCRNLTPAQIAEKSRTKAPAWRIKVPDEEIRCYRKGKSAAVDALVITPENQKSLTRLIPQAGDFPLKENKNTFYVCEGEHCQPPVEELL